MIFVDSNVLIDVAQADPVWGEWSEERFAEAFDSGEALVSNILVYAELSRSFASTAALDILLGQLQIELLNIPRDAAFAASGAHQRYRRAGGTRAATLPHFFIAAHAHCLGARLLTRDATRVRTYFPDLSVIAPA